MRGVEMKITLLSLLTMMICSSLMASNNEYENIVVNYEVTYETGFIFKKEKSFTISFFEAEEGKPGPLLFESEELGTCDHINNVGGRAEYGYIYYYDQERLTKLDGFDEYLYIQSTIFCENGWYNLIIETQSYALESLAVGEETKAGFYMKDKTLKTLIDKKATIKRLP